MNENSECMFKILSQIQIRSLDAYTLQHTPIASIDLMERACLAFVQWFVQRFDSSKKVGIICGTGNNGGDGLGIARILNDWGYWVSVWIVRGPGNETGNFKINFDRLDKRIKVSDFVFHASAEAFTGRDILIDAVFGSGLSRPAEGIYA